MIPVPLMLTLALLSATAPFATDMYLPVLPHIAGEFGVEQVVAQFTLTGFFVGMAFGQLLIGPVSDVVGRRRLLLWSAGLALVASVLAALAPGIGVLILARILQGLGGGACNVLARSVVPDLLSGSAAAKAFSVLMTIGGIAPAIAPVIGGLLAEPVGWRGIFWTLTGLHAVQLLLAFLLVPETGGKAERTGGLVRTVAGNYLTVVRMPLVWGFLLAMAFGFGALFSYISASSFVLQTVYGFSPAHYSLLFAINALGMLVATIINSRLVTRFGAVTMLRAGLLLCIGGGLILTVAAVADAPWYLIVACVLLAGGFHHGQRDGAGHGHSPRACWLHLRGHGLCPVALGRHRLAAYGLRIPPHVHDGFRYSDLRDYCGGCGLLGYLTPSTRSGLGGIGKLLQR